MVLVGWVLGSALAFFGVAFVVALLCSSDEKTKGR